MNEDEGPSTLPMMTECLDLPEPVLASVAEAERLGFAVQSVAENRIPAVDVDTDVESVVDALTVVFTREDQEPLLTSWVELDGVSQYAKGSELPSPNRHAEARRPPTC